MARAGFERKEDRSIALADKEDVFGDRDRLAPGFPDGQGIGIAGGAEGVDRAGQASRRGRRAVGLPELHEGRIEQAGIS